MLTASPRDVRCVAGGSDGRVCPTIVAIPTRSHTTQLTERPNSNHEVGEVGLFCPAVAALHGTASGPCSQPLPIFSLAKTAPFDEDMHHRGIVPTCTSVGMSFATWRCGFLSPHGEQKRRLDADEPLATQKLAAARPQMWKRRWGRPILARACSTQTRHQKQSQGLCHCRHLFQIHEASLKRVYQSLGGGL